MEIKCPPEGLLGGGPLRTTFEAVALGKAEAPESVGRPTAGGRLRHPLVMQSESDRVIHVLPVAHLPFPILCEIDAQFRELADDRLGDISLSRPPVTDDGLPDGLDGVLDEFDPVAPGLTTEQSTERWQSRQGIEWAPGDMLHHNGARPIRPNPNVERLPNLAEASRWSDVPQWQNTVCKDLLPGKDCVAQLS